MAIARMSSARLRAALQSVETWRNKAKAAGQGCVLVTKKPNKKTNGYPLESETLLPMHLITFFANQTNGFTRSVQVREGYHVSHLCGNSTCINVAHLTHESAVYNQRRKGCVAVAECGSCGVRLQLCQHIPMCVTSVTVTCSRCEEAIVVD